MKRSVSIVTAVALMLLTAVLTFQITYITVAGNAADRTSKGESTADYDSDAFMEKVVERLSAIDEKYRELYIGELDEEVLIDYILKGYVAGTGDVYGAYYTNDEMFDFMSEITGETEGIGVNVIFDYTLGAIEIVSVMPDSPALDAGIKVGDLIVYVGEDREAVADIGYNAAIAKMRGKEGTVATLTVLRGEEFIDFSITRAKVTATTVYSHVSELDSTVGIIRITGFDRDTTFDQFKEAFEALEAEGCKSFIFDLRNNPGGELGSVVDTLDYLLPKGPVIRIFDKDDNLVEQYDSDESHKDYPMAVLVNGNTASAAELFTSALRDYKVATVVGETTFGKGCMQTSVSLPDGGALSVTFRMYKPPFSEGYHEVGIVPDIEIAPEGALLDKHFLKVTDSEDNQLIKALEELTK